jgi:ATP-dependent DNA helicase Rep
MSESLNPAQLAAVHCVGGPCLVLAGAGSGKTRVITHKIARLLQAGYAPKQIAAITFTNKAAQEMRERARALVGASAAKDLAISTFHALGVRILRSDGMRLGLKERFSILDSDDALGVLRDAGATTDKALARRWQWAISAWKNQGLDGMQAQRVAESGEGAKRADLVVAARVMQRYEERLTAYQAVDFDDLIRLPLQLLRGDEEARSKWRDTLRYLLVDEYQDTNATQYELLKLLADGKRPMFTVVGDDDQSIYGWRGATIENLRRVQHDYPTLKVIALEQNYRSTGSILRAANAVIAHNPKLYEKKLWCDQGDGDPVAVIECDGEDHEAERALARLQTLRAQGGEVRWSDFAILYRANHQAKVFEQKLRAAQVPYMVSGGQSFFERAEIRDLCAWLRLIVNEDDDPAFLRAVTTPRRGVGHQTLASLGEFASKWKTSLFEALFANSLHTVLAGKAISSLHEFGRIVNDLQHRARHTSGAHDAKDLLLGWLKDIGYEQHLHDTNDSASLGAARWSNVIDFVDWIARRCGDDATVGALEGDKQNVLQVAQTISVIISLAERAVEQDAVTLSTLHAAKGLEWPHVVLASVNEGLLPFCSDGEDVTPERLSEERRLMYVGITRARRTLAISTLSRRKRGREVVAGVPSRFIAEMKLRESTAQEDPRERLKRQRAELAARVALVGTGPLNH